nr:MerR family transcriptional regulator [Thermoactinomyces sp. CICC 10522]
MGQISIYNCIFLHVSRTYPYTVKQVSKIANVTVKTLHHYHKIGLLLPCEVNDAGYRLYGRKELERLQEILFYRELDFPLKKIKEILTGEHDRIRILKEQKRLLQARMERTADLIQTINESIRSAEKGEPMDQADMFKGFETEEEWRNAMREQTEYLKENYGHDLGEKPIVPEEMNEEARKAQQFITGMARALASGIKHTNSHVQHLIDSHVAGLKQRHHIETPRDFAAMTRFFLDDDFHRQMLENQQTGLAYYLCLAAEHFADKMN